MRQKRKIEGLVDMANRLNVWNGVYHRPNPHWRNIHLTIVLHNKQYEKCGCGEYFLLSGDGYGSEEDFGMVLVGKCGSGRNVSMVFVGN